MDTTTVLYAVPAGVCLIFKIFYLFRLETRSIATRAFVLLCLALVAQNATEFCGYLAFNSDLDQAKWFVNLYMIATYWLIYAALVFMTTISETLSNRIRLVAATAPLSITVLHFSGLLISGYEDIGYSIITIPGEFYFLFQIYAISTIGICYASIIYKALSAKQSALKARSFIAAIGLLPYAGSSLVIMILMSQGIKVSTSLILPVSSLFFLLCCAYTTKKDIFDYAGMISAYNCLLYTSPSPRDGLLSRMPSSA